MDLNAIAGHIANWQQKFPAALVRKQVQLGLQMVLDEDYDWGFLYKESYVCCPALVEGAAAVTRWSTTVTLDSTTKTAFNTGITNSNVPGEEWQIRVDSGNLAPRKFYSIASYDSSTGVITLATDDPYLNDTDSAASIKLSKIYYTPPLLQSGEPDFKRYISWIDYKEQRRLRIAKSYFYLDKIDPTRTYSSSMPFCLASRGDVFDSEGRPIPRHELYPYYNNTTYDKLYRIAYWSSGASWLQFEESATSINLPSHISDNLIIEATKIAMCDWADANKGDIPELTKTNWQNLKMSLTSEALPYGYNKLLADAILNDANRFNKSVVYEQLANIPYVNYEPYLPFNWNELVYENLPLLPA